MNEDTALVPYAQQQMGALRPVVSPTDMVQAIKEYEAIKAAIIQKKDTYQPKGSSKPAIKKSGWLRIARAFGVTVEPVSEQFERADDGTWGYAIVVRAVAPNGASMQGDGMCWNTEKSEGQRTRHNVRAHAYTRATNRAISNLVGGGEVSAEELQDFRDDDDDFTQPAPRLHAAPRIQEQSAPQPKHAASWSSLRILGNQLGWSVEFYAQELKRICGDKPAREYTQTDLNTWQAHLTDLLKRQESGELTPDPEMPHDLRTLDASKIGA